MKNLKPSSVPVHYECDQCDEKYESLCKLKSHIRTFHMKTFCTQTEEKTVEDKNVQCEREQLVSDKTFQTPEVKKEFEKYQCFYCEKDVAREFRIYSVAAVRKSGILLELCQGIQDLPCIGIFSTLNKSLV